MFLRQNHLLVGLKEVFHRCSFVLLVELVLESQSFLNLTEVGLAL